MHEKVAIIAAIELQNYKGNLLQILSINYSIILNFCKNVRVGYKFDWNVIEEVGEWDARLGIPNEGNIAITARIKLNLWEISAGLIRKPIGRNAFTHFMYLTFFRH